jgi:hypothetical protein
MPKMNKHNVFTTLGVVSILPHFVHVPSCYNL